MSDPDFFDRFPNFTADEFRCTCGCGACSVSEELVRRLQLTRWDLGFSLPVTSGYRCPQHPIEARKTAPGPHNTGRAADIGISGANARLLLENAAERFDGIGIKQHGPHEKRFIHLDFNCGFRCWSYGD